MNRLALVGAVPNAQGARLPPPLRLMLGLLLVPGLGALVSRMVKPSPKSVVKMMGFFGEGETVAGYPEQIEAQVVAGRDPGVERANRAEMRAVGSASSGLRREFLLQPDELARLTTPTLLVWGEHDPIGGPEVARALADAIPGAMLELLPTAHMPWFAEPDRTAELVAEFIHGPVPDNGASD